MSDHTILLVDFPPPSLSAAALSIIDTTPTPVVATSKETIIMARTTTTTTNSGSRPTYYEREDSLNNSVNLTRYSVAQNSSVPLPQETGDDESDVIIWDDPDEPLLHGGDAESDVIIWDDPDDDNGKVDQQESTQHQLPCQQHHHDYDYDKKETKSTSSSISISSANVNDDEDDDDHDHEESYRRLTIRDGIQIKVIDGGDVYVCRPSLTSKDLLFVDFGCARDSFCSSVHSSASSSLSLLSASVHRSSSSSSCHEQEDAPPQENNRTTTTTRKQTKSVQFAPIPQIHPVESFLNSGVWYTESDLDVFQRQKEKDIAMIKVLQRFSSGSRRGSMDSFSSSNNGNSGSRRASVESNPSSRRGSVESSSDNNNNYNNNYDPMADYAKMRLEKANTTPIGLENHVCSKMAIGEMNQRRVEHCRAVLGEQKRQRSLVVVQPQQQEKRRGGMIKTFFKTSNTTTSNTATAATANNKHDVDQQVERIAEISSTYSELSRKRAEVNGTLHAENDCCKIIRAGHQMSRGVSARSLSARRLSIGEVSGGPSLPTPPSA